MRVSRIIPVINRDAFAEKYEFWKMQTSEKYLKKGAAILDAEPLDGKVEAVFHFGGKSAWVMLAKGAESRALLKAAVESVGDESISFEAVSLDAIPDRDLLMLAFCSLAKSKFGSLSCSNVSGRLLVVCPKHIKGRGGKVTTVHAIEVRISEDLSMSLGVRTFSSLSMKKYMRGGATAVDKLPRYELLGGHFLRRTLSKGADDPDAFVERSIGKNRYRVSFLDVSSKDAFLSSKVGVLDEVLQRLDERYGDTIRVSFEDIEDTSRIDCRTRGKDVWRTAVAQALEFSQISVIDTTGEYAELADEAATKIWDMFGIPASVSSDVASDAVNLRIIHDDEFYVDGADPHDDSFPGIAVQHLTIEKAESGDEIPEAVLENSVKELAVKLNIIEKRMTLAYWPGLGLGGAWSFCVPISPDNPDDSWRYAFIDIDGDGRMDCSLEEFSFIEPAAHQDVIDELSLRAHEDISFAIKGPGGDINIVGRSELYSIPNHEEIASCFAGDSKPGRGGKARSKMFADVTDIAFSKTDEEHGYYRVGIVGYGMNTSIANASILREVCTIPGSKLLFPEALSLMDVDFVRMREPSVTPFPLKYLREWLRINYPAFAGDM